MKHCTVPVCYAFSVRIEFSFLSLFFPFNIYVAVEERASDVLNAGLPSSDVHSTGFAWDFSGVREGVALCQ